MLFWHRYTPLLPAPSFTVEIGVYLFWQRESTPTSKTFPKVDAGLCAVLAQIPLPPPLQLKLVCAVLAERLYQSPSFTVETGVYFVGRDTPLFYS